MNYRGFDIHFDPKPIPTREFDWIGTDENYEASYEGPEDGWVTSGEYFYGSTQEDVTNQIDEFLAGQNKE